MTPTTAAAAAGTTARTAGAAWTAQDRLPAPPRPRRRGAELALTGAAVLLCLYGYQDLAPARHDATGSPLRYAAELGVPALLAHLAVRFRAPHADPLLLPVAVLLNGLGLVLIHRLDLDTPGEPAAPAQTVWSLAGLALFTAVVLGVRDHRRIQRYAYLSAVAALALMALPLAFPPVNGARIWLRAGGFSLQPAEFAKVLVTVFFAAYLAVNRRALAHLPRRPHRPVLPVGRVTAPLLTVWLASVGILLLERDLGSSLLFFGLFVLLLYVATGRTGWIAAGLLLAGLGAWAVSSLEAHVHARVADWLHPFATIDAGEGTGQLAQSLFAFAAGGLFGTGLGRGHSFLVGFAARSDFVLATAGEELGLVGLTALLLLYALLVARGYRTALGLSDAFGRLLALGLSALLGLQVFVITAGVMGLIPLTGMAMPFLAQGGSSTVTNWVVVALLVRLSDRARTPDTLRDTLQDAVPAGTADTGPADTETPDPAGTETPDPAGTQSVSEAPAPDTDRPAHSPDAADTAELPLVPRPPALAPTTAEGGAGTGTAAPPAPAGPTVPVGPAVPVAPAGPGRADGLAVAPADAAAEGAREAGR